MLYLTHHLSLRVHKGDRFELSIIEGRDGSSRLGIVTVDDRPLRKTRPKKPLFERQFARPKGSRQLLAAFPKY